MSVMLNSSLPPGLPYVGRQDQEGAPSLAGWTSSAESDIAADESASVAYVIGPDGNALTLEMLPGAGEQRWVVQRKAQVVAAVTGGLLTLEDALQRFDLTLDEYAGWARAVERSGLPGLRVTQSQRYRAKYRRQQRFS